MPHDDHREGVRGGVSKRRGGNVSSQRDAAPQSAPHGSAASSYPTIAPQSAGTTWAAIADGPAGEAVRARILDILDVTASLIRRPEGWTRFLAGGKAGVATFLNYLPDDIRSADTDRQMLDLLSGSLQGTFSSFEGWSLFEGETGVYWALNHCAGPWKDPGIAEVLDDVDRRILTVLEQLRPAVSYDLISGIVGIGVHSLGRLPSAAARQCLEAAVDHLDASAVRDRHGLCWPTPPSLLRKSTRRRYPDGWIDLGMAHGVAGVIAFLSLVHAAGVRQERTARLVRAALSWLLEAARPVPGELRFPFQIALRGPMTGKRNAWCYGDAGVAAAVMTAARSFRNREWEAIALDLARSAAACRGRAAGVADGGLCHGAGGLAHIFNRLYQSTGDPELLVAARYWFDILLDMRTDEGFAGYAAWGSGGWESERGLLEGTAGIGLALIAMITDRAPAWDRAFLLS